ncbi:glycyl-tRNA synthetase beta chain [Paucidesulfovibrio gracilis DSM 16080]|uniref:Glycine--tRNA ligase beta subunit n=1 Tax=Paucidesulfovibrio gracilis DSM 16080 TaxID=1121449 RepID=A0A1T4WUQ2_9BACT|nr:glycine--tRNA ligase subunit beta [Paucidesulfovibrio gracilis]SKA80827.1 glycyl-tRNA synthetase beta chain [Paucidesulfovibrio gracilis DSM 16080]
MAEFVFEIGTEEMPARFVPKLAEQLRESLSVLLEQAMVDHRDVRTYATPRRIVALIADMADQQRTQEEEVTGPPSAIAYKDGELTKAGSGFAKTQGVRPEDLYTVQTAKGEYLAARKTLGGGKTVDVLPGICIECIKKMSFPKKMHWGDYDFTFGRPIRWLLALLDENVVPFQVNTLESGRQTFGHRVMGAGPFEVARAGDYARIAQEECRVMLDPEERVRVIRERGDALAKEKGGEIVWDEGLLREVANLVEIPVPVLGDIDPLYLELPAEVLLTSMQSHQKSFGVRGADGRLLPHFLTTLNLEPSDTSLVKKGWERVLKARLEDARFFWEADIKTDLGVWLDKLEHVVFLGPLGSMGDKSRRLERLCGKLAERLGETKGIAPGELAAYARAGRLAKSDLVSEMVNEFDSLQGVMGGIYAHRAGEGDVVADAIREQYRPAGPDSPVPTSLSGAILSMADKADTLAGCFGLGKIPTGANDPYALRRCALGIARIIMEHGLNLNLRNLLSAAFEGYSDVKWKIAPDQALDRLMDFFGQRLRALFSGRGISVLVAEAALGAGFDDIRTLQLRMEALEAFSKDDDFEQSVLTFKRAANIIRKQGAEADQELTGHFRSDLLVEEPEKALAERLEQSESRFETLWKDDDFAGLLGSLRDLRPDVDAFFDGVMVMCEDVELRQNRLNTLKSLVDRLGRLADFSALQV